MFGLRYVVLCTGVLAVSFGSVNGLSDDEKAEIKNLLLPIAVECGKDYGVTEETLVAAKKAGTLTELDPCILACMLKKMGIMNDAGMLDADKSTELAKKFLPDDDDQKKALNIINTCASVNDKPVGDGEKGCDRAALLIKCYLPLKGEVFPGAA